MFFYSILYPLNSCLIKRREGIFKQSKWLVVGVFEKEHNNMFLTQRFIDEFISCRCKVNLHLHYIFFKFKNKRLIAEKKNKKVNIKWKIKR
jgi:hypothetical protein